MKQTPAIKVEGISKSFNKTIALDKVSLSIPRGSVCGLLGPNGAGKTTLVSILTTLVYPTKGNAEICGFDLLKMPNDVRKRIGVVFQESVIDEDLSAYENLDLHARLYKIPSSEREERINSLLRLVSLEDVKHNKVKTFSGGMKRKVEVIRGLLNNPEVLFLDEPTLGLDPPTRRKIWEHILQINRERGTTILLTTHYMDEAQFLCSDITIINKGRIIISGKKGELLRKINKDKLIVELFSGIEEAYRALRKKFPMIALEDNKIVIRTEDAEKKIQKIISLLSRTRSEIESVQIVKPNLEEVFMKYAGEELH